MTPTPTLTTGHIDVTTLRERLAVDAPRILDVRTPAEFETAHIPGSYNVPLDLLREHRTELTHPPRRRRRPRLPLRRPRQPGRAGTRRGRNARLVSSPAGSSAGRLPTPRSTEGGRAGTSNARSGWSPAPSSPPASSAAPSPPASSGSPRPIGTGLAGAAVTNTCAMGTALSKMPWNRVSDTTDIGTVIKSLQAPAV